MQLQCDIASDFGRNSQAAIVIIIEVLACVLVVTILVCCILAYHRRYKRLHPNEGGEVMVTRADDGSDIITTTTNIPTSSMPSYNNLDSTPPMTALPDIKDSPPSAPPSPTHHSSASMEQRPFVAIPIV
jgi:hypothetical protein